MEAGELRVVRAALRIVDREIAKVTPTWNNGLISQMESTHIRNTIKQLNGWARDRWSQGGLDSRLYNGFTIRETLNALKRELNKRY